MDIIAKDIIKKVHFEEFSYNISANNNTAIEKTSIKIIPAPLGFPTDFEPLCANSLPISFGKNLENFAIAKQVPKNANNTPINANFGASSTPSK